MMVMERLTQYGIVVGADESADSGALCWKGVPFAKAPIGDLRWRAPVEPDCWSTPRPAVQFGNACVQVGRLYGPGRNNRYDRSIGDSIGDVSGSEDCLYLNIWVPASASGPLPVIVYIHGGSNVTGYTADPLYDGATLAVTANAVVVTVNYRLGIFGFLNLPQMKTGGDPAGDSGNFALLDIYQALRFVNRNIGAFGGDSGKVTLMGQSAGAVNILALLASPLLTAAQPPLIHRILPVSGGIAMAGDLPPGRLPLIHPAAAHAAQAEALVVHALVRAGRTDDVKAAKQWIADRSHAEVSSWLRAQDAEVLLRTVLVDLTPLGLAGSGPIPDGTIVPLAPLAAIHAGHYCKVPMLAGFTRDEGKLFPSMLALSPALGQLSGRLLSDREVFSIQYSEQRDQAVQSTIEQWITPQLLPVWAPGTGFNARIEQLHELLFWPNRDVVLDAVRAEQQAVWAYQFDWDQQPPPFDDIYGAAHGFDVPFMFGNFGPSLFAATMNTSANRPGRLALSEAMMRSIGSFAWHGDPNHAELGVRWSAWPDMLRFDASASAPAISVKARPEGANS